MMIPTAAAIVPNSPAVQLRTMLTSCESDRGLPSICSSSSCATIVLGPWGPAARC